MATNQSFENSRVSEGTLRTDRTQTEIANMIAEGGPVPREASVPAPDRLGLAAASTLLGHRVLRTGEESGNIEELLLDLESGAIEFAVLSFGGLSGIANQRFPVPWSALRIDPGERVFILDSGGKALENTPHFDKDHWPDMADPVFSRVVHKHYGTTPNQGWRH